MPTQGSCLPVVLNFTALLFRSIEFLSIKIELVGFTAKRVIIGWPVDMPPKTPPA